MIGDRPSSAASLCVLIDAAAAAAEALDALADRLALPRCSPAQAAAYRFHLIHDQGRLALRENLRGAAAPTVVDFSDAALNWRRRSSGKHQGIGRAVGLRKLKTPRVLDCSAGLGRDGFILAALGCQVTLLERAPLMHALLEDGLRRAAASEDAELRTIVARLSLHQADARDWLDAIRRGEQEAPEVVYIDPMFPTRGKAAKVKKDMAMLQRMLGADEDVEEVLSLAREVALKRVVLKRPAGKVGQATRQPDFRVEGKASRFDVYLSANSSA